MYREKISVIVPIYNSEKKIQKNIESIINQTYSNLEIILINDGSTDKSPEIIEKYAKEDYRIKVINQENQGVSFSRNVGIELATGQYITFIDADDFIAKNYMEKLYNEAKKESCDIVKCLFRRNNFEIKYFKEKMIYNLKNKEEIQLLENEMFRTFKFNQVWGQLIKSNIVKKLRFDINLKMGEDYIFNYYLYQNANRISILPDCLYFYNVSENGISNNIEPSAVIRKINDILILYNKIYINQNLVLERAIKEVIPHLLAILVSKKINYLSKRSIFESIENNEIIKKAIINIKFEQFKNYRYKYMVKFIYNNNYNKAFLYANIVYKPIKKIQKILNHKKIK